MLMAAKRLQKNVCCGKALNIHLYKVITTKTKWHLFPNTGATVFSHNAINFPYNIYTGY